MGTTTILPTIPSSGSHARGILGKASIKVSRKIRIKRVPSKDYMKIYFKITKSVIITLRL